MSKNSNFTLGIYVGKGWKWDHLPAGYTDHTVTSTPEGVFVTVRARPLVGQEAPRVGGDFSRFANGGTPGF